MKFIYYLLIPTIFFLAISFSSLAVPKFSAFAQNTYYARIETDNVHLYSAPITDESCKMFILPKTYFVLLTDSADDLFYSCLYDGISGYVLKKDVKAVVGAPLNPFLKNINFRVFVPSGANLRSSPYSSGSLNLVYAIPYLDNNLSYLGVIEGDEAIPKKGKTWYFCKYYSGNTEYMGYVYSALCDELSPIVSNTENLEYMTQNPVFNTTPPITSNGFEGLSETTTTIIIIAVSLPCLLFIYLLFKPSSLAKAESKQKGKNGKKKISRLKHSDYFEYDDDF